MSRRWTILLIVMGSGWLPVLALPEAIRMAAALHALAASSHPYFAPAYAPLLYILAPLVALSASLLVLSPGLLAAAAAGIAGDAGTWVVSGLGLSLVIDSAAAAMMQLWTGEPVTGRSFAFLLAVCAGLAALALLLRARRRALPFPLESADSQTTLWFMAGAGYLLLVLLAPKFFWESLNGDGVHTFESARLLLRQSVPFWPAEAGGMASWPGWNCMVAVYPASWFLRLFGPLEVSARLPILLHLPALYGAVSALVAHGREEKPAAPQCLLIWLSLAAYTVTMAFSATYNPYAADLAQPLAEDTLTLVCFLGFVLFFLRDQRVWMSLFLVLTVTSLSGGALLVLLWLCAAVATSRPVPWRQLTCAAAVLVTCWAAAALAPEALRLAGLPAGGGEHSAAGLVSRFGYLQFRDWRRVLFLLIPGGILPAFALLAWKRQDPLARALTLVTAAYFWLFYVQAYTVLHHYFAIMLLPVVVFWRTAVPRPSLLIAAGVAGAVALVWSLPRDATPSITARQVGSEIEDRLGGYGESDPLAFRRSEILWRLFPPDWNPSVPAGNYGGTALEWFFYARRDGSRGNYILQQAAAPAPPGVELVAQADGAAVYVRDKAMWARHQRLRPPSPAGSPIYWIPRPMMFRPSPDQARPNIYVILDRLGIRH